MAAVFSFHVGKPVVDAAAILIPINHSLDKRPPEALTDYLVCPRQYAILFSHKYVFMGCYARPMVGIGLITGRYALLTTYHGIHRPVILPFVSSTKIIFVW